MMNKTLMDVSPGRGSLIEIPGYVLTLMEGLDCPRSLTVAILIRHREWEQLTQLTCDPFAYDDSEAYWCAVMATDLLRKCVDIPLDVDLEEKAVAAFLQNEHTCLRTNLRLEPYLYGMSDPSTDVRIVSFFADVRKTVYEMIGPGPIGETRYCEVSEGLQMDYDEFSLKGRFGPGATQSDTARECTTAHKLMSVPTLTPNAAGLLASWKETMWAEAQADLGTEPRVIEGNAFFTVLKDATQLRGCAKEPSINVHYQMAYGRQLRKKLKRWGINLSDGQFLHRKLAREGSVSGFIATIDLRSASDTNCTNLVKLCTPPRWFAALNGCRSPKTVLPDGRCFKLEKFSSMGNGFTFELETIIFAAIAYVACGGSAIIKQNFSVYGDDIIVPVEKSNNVISALKFCGFTPNKRKTFGTGAFRESCGGDFFNGVSVRPHLVEELPYEPQHYIAMANGLRRAALQDPSCEISRVRWDRVRRAWFQVQDYLPNSIRRCRGPEGLGDITIHDVDSQCESRTRSSIRWYRVYRPAQHRWVRWSDFPASVQFAAALYGVSRNPMGNLIPRDSVSGYKVGWTSSS